MFALLVEGVKSGIGNHTSSASPIDITNALKVYPQSVPGSSSKEEIADDTVSVHLLPRDHLRYSHVRNESQSRSLTPSMGQKEVSHLSLVPGNLPRRCNLHLRRALLPLGMQTHQPQMGIYEPRIMLATQWRDLGWFRALQCYD